MPIPKGGDLPCAGGRAADHMNAGDVEGKFNEYTCIHEVSGVPHVFFDNTQSPASSGKNRLVGMSA